MIKHEECYLCLCTITTESRSGHVRGRGSGSVQARRGCSRDVLGGEVGHDAVDEVLAHDDGADRLPVGRVLAEQQADGLERHLHDGGRVAHRAHLHQVLLLNGFHRCVPPGPPRPPPAKRERQSTKEGNKKGFFS